MAEGTYEHACMRAELLGMDKPNKEDFLRTQPQASRIECENEKIEAAQFEVIKYYYLYIFPAKLTFSIYLEIL